MSKITRVLQKIFGGNSSDIVQFGSRAANSTLYTQDVGLIQSLSAWTAGWRSALIAKEASLQDQDAVNFVTTSQLAYLFQEGMPEYDASTTYYTNSIVKKNGTTQLYVSLTDNNIGNPLADTANWAAGVDIGVGISTILPFPDYSNGINIVSGTVYQAATNGYIVMTASSSNSLAACSLAVGLTSNPTVGISNIDIDTGNYTGMTYPPVPIAQGFYYKWTSVAGTTACKWYPCLTS